MTNNTETSLINPIQILINLHDHNLPELLFKILQYIDFYDLSELQNLQNKKISEIIQGYRNYSTNFIIWLPSSYYDVEELKNSPASKFLFDKKNYRLGQSFGESSSQDHKNLLIFRKLMVNEGENLMDNDIFAGCLPQEEAVESTLGLSVKVQTDANVNYCLNYRLFVNEILESFSSMDQTKNKKDFWVKIDYRILLNNTNKFEISPKDTYVQFKLRVIKNSKLVRNKTNGKTLNWKTENRRIFNHKEIPVSEWGFYRPKWVCDNHDSKHSEMRINLSDHELDDVLNFRVVYKSRCDHYIEEGFCDVCRNFETGVKIAFGDLVLQKI